MTPVYFLPGTMCDERMWQPMLSSLTVDIDATFLSIPMLNSIEAIVDEVVLQLPNTPINLVGFSLGGYLATALAMRYPERVLNLFVMANMPCALPEAEVKERTRTINWLKTHGYKGIPQKRVLNLLDPSHHLNQGIISLIKQMDADLGGEVLTQQLKATTLRENLFTGLPNLAINKHFCAGESDALVSLSALNNYVQTDSLAKLTVLPNTGHMLPLESPSACAQWLEQRLK
ncbi:alpha/beta fold hydrolase [Thalassotalea marina]|uniref:Alpha/beta hydrolase n=1 Tax=Thalassotalea marina TaxID=1673741 RepID=A0A919BCF5_9GAMM|nr:alpha/beta hydrolase [Thalassotalea marina]GHF80060.1 alpha/beta hydrolase [Thalassotalea marina]